MNKVKRLIEAGLPIPEAIRGALGMPITAFADLHGIPRPQMSLVVNGGLRPTQRHLAALIAELGGSEFEWRVLLWEAGKPVPSQQSAA